SARIAIAEFGPALRDHLLGPPRGLPDPGGDRPELLLAAVGPLSGSAGTVSSRQGICDAEAERAVRPRRVLGTSTTSAWLRRLSDRDAVNEAAGGARSKGPQHTSREGRADARLEPEL